jgi:hypothetical protein
MQAPSTTPGTVAASSPACQSNVRELLGKRVGGRFKKQSQTAKRQCLGRDGTSYVGRMLADRLSSAMKQRIMVKKAIVTCVTAIGSEREKAQEMFQSASRFGSMNMFTVAARATYSHGRRPEENSKIPSSPLDRLSGLSCRPLPHLQHEFSVGI